MKLEKTQKGAIRKVVKSLVRMVVRDSARSEAKSTAFCDHAALREEVATTIRLVAEGIVKSVAKRSDPNLRTKAAKRAERAIEQFLQAWSSNQALYPKDLGKMELWIARQIKELYQTLCLPKFSRVGGKLPYEVVQAEMVRALQSLLEILSSVREHIMPRGAPSSN